MMPPTAFTFTESCHRAMDPLLVPFPGTDPANFLEARLSGISLVDRLTIPGYDSFRMPTIPLPCRKHSQKSKPRDNCGWYLADVGINPATLGLDRYAWRARQAEDKLRLR
jgi:hypothetical protein